MPNSDMAGRVEWLENLVALQEQTIDELNQALVNQQRQLDTVERQVEILALKLRQLLQTQEQVNIQDVPPPHYG